jgi:hypothetical protein
MFGKKTRQDVKIPFDRESSEAVLRCSICTGEEVACFRDKKTGKLREISLIQSRDDLVQFLSDYGINENDLKKIY